MLGLVLGVLVITCRAVVFMCQYFICVCFVDEVVAFGSIAQFAVLSRSRVFPFSVRAGPELAWARAEVREPNIHGGDERG